MGLKPGGRDVDQSDASHQIMAENRGHWLDASRSALSRSVTPWMNQSIRTLALRCKADPALSASLKITAHRADSVPIV
jgi:hypothetical protein